jgi:hypothetical protein
MMAQKVEAAANVVVQLILHEPGVYGKRHADCASHDKINLAWERIFHDTKEPGSRLKSFEII